MDTKSNLLYTPEENLQIKFDDLYTTLKYVAGTLEDIGSMKKRTDRAVALYYMQERVKWCLKRISK